MNLLAVDTSTEACSAAALIGEEVIERYELAPRRHAELILPMVEAVLAEGGLTVHQLDALAFGCGPGGFTGLRIAAGVVQGIAFGADLPVAPVSTLAAIARQTMNEQDTSRVAAAIDARMQEVYWGAYRFDAETELILIGEERVCSPTVVSPLEGDGWIGAGSGWAAYGDTLSRRLGIESWWGDCYPRAGDIAALGALLYQRGEAVPVERALPVYLRDEVVRKAG